MQEPSYHYIAPLVLLQMVQGDLPMFRQLSQTFIEISPPMLAQLETVLQSKNKKNLAQACHALKGATALVGAAQLTTMLADMEKAARVDPASGGPHQIPELKRLFDLTMQEVQSSILSFKGQIKQVTGPDSV